MWWTFLMRRKNPRGGSLWGFLVLMKTMIDIKKKLYGIPYSFMTCPGIEPGFTPWEGVVLTAWPTGRNRGDKIRTCDLCVPNAALYQTEPRLDVFKALRFVLFTSDSYIIAWPWKKCKRFLKKFQFFEKKLFRRIFRVRGNSHKALFYKEKQRLKSIGIASYNREEKYPESSQKPKKWKETWKFNSKIDKNTMILTADPKCKHLQAIWRCKNHISVQSVIQNCSSSDWWNE